MRLPVWSALEGAVLVADMRVLEVRPTPNPESGFGSQYLRYRLERIYKAPPGIREGQEVWVVYRGCNSQPHDTRRVGGSAIHFVSNQRGQLAYHYCSTSLSSGRPVPQELVVARRRWLERAR